MPEYYSDQAAARVPDDAVMGPEYCAIITGELHKEISIISKR